MGRRWRVAARVAVVAGLVLLMAWLLFAVVFPWVDRGLNDPVLAPSPPGVDRATAAAPAIP